MTPLRPAGAGPTFRRAQWLVTATLVFCALYALIAFPTHNNPPMKRFPFYAWALFDKVNGPTFSDFSVRIVEAKGMRTPLPVYFESARLGSQATQVQGFTLLQTLGKSIANGDDVNAKLARQRFESTYLRSLSDVRYEVVRRTYDARERVDCRDCFVRERVIATYQTG